MYVCVCVYVCVSTFSIIVSCETTGLIEAKIHVEPPWDGGTKVCSNGPGHMMATMPTYGKNLNKSSSLKLKDLPLKQIWYVASVARVLPSLFK